MGLFVAIPWFIRAVAASVIFPVLLRCLSRLRCFKRCASRQNKPSSSNNYSYNSSASDGTGRATSSKTTLTHNLLEAASALGEEEHSEEGGRAGGGGGEGGRGSSVLSDRERGVLEKGYETCLASLWILRGGVAISVASFGCFGLATTTPILFVLCSVEGLAAVWDSACAVLLTTLADVDVVHQRHQQRRLATHTQQRRQQQQRCIVVADEEDSSFDGVTATVSVVDTDIIAGSGERDESHNNGGGGGGGGGGGDGGGVGDSGDHGAVLGLRALLQTSMAVVGQIVFTVSKKNDFVV